MIYENEFELKLEQRTFMVFDASCNHISAGLDLRDIYSFSGRVCGLVRPLWSS